MPETGDADLDIDFDAELAQIQGQAAEIPQPPPAAEVEVAEGTVVTSARTVEFMGERFRVAEKIGLMPLLKFSAHADMNTSDPGALAAMYSMLKDSIHEGTPACGKCIRCKNGDEEGCAAADPGDWKRFEQHAIDTKADADELLDVITRVIELISGRPTEQPSGSSPGRQSTRGASTARSSARGRRGSRR